MNILSRARVAQLSIALLLLLVGLSVPLLLSGCGQGDKDTPSAKQTVSDEELIKAQGACPISGKPLGSMGKPVKITVKDQPVFLCCDSCEEKAKAEADKTLAKVKELKKK